MEKLKEEDKTVFLGILEVMDEIQLREAFKELLKLVPKEQMPNIAFSLGAGMGSKGGKKPNDRQSSRS